VRKIAEWSFLAACHVSDAEALFLPNAHQNAVKRICRDCPVRYECLAEALDNRIDTGIWGGMTERERRALLRRNPGVSDWWTVIDSARPMQDGRPVKGR